MSQNVFNEYTSGYDLIASLILKSISGVHGYSHGVNNRGGM